MIPDIDSLELVDTDLLPPQMRQYVQVIGLTDTFKLLQARGGTIFRFPVNAKDSLLADIIGLESAIKLCAVLGGEVKELPKVDKILLQIRNHAVRNARKYMSAAEASRKFNLSRRQIINISPEPGDLNGDLFESISD